MKLKTFYIKWYALSSGVNIIETLTVRAATKINAKRQAMKKLGASGWVFVSIEKGK